MFIRKTLICLAIAAMAVPAIVNARTFKTILVSLTAEEVVVRNKEEKQTFKVTESTKILDKDGNAVAVDDVTFKIVLLTTDPENEEAAAEIKEVVPKKK